MAIPGTKRRTYLVQNCAAANVKLTKEEIESLARAFPLNATAGTRYPEKQLVGLGIWRRAGTASDGRPLRRKRAHQVGWREWAPVALPRLLATSPDRVSES